MDRVPLEKSSDNSSYQTIHRYFMVWTQKNIFREAYSIAYKLQNRPTRRNLRFQCIDASFVKNIYGRDCVGRNPTDRGRKATKLSAIVDQDGLPLSLVFFPANVHDVHTVESTLNNRIVETYSSQPLYADKGYDSRKVRSTIRQYGNLDRVGKRGTIVHRVVNRRRNIVERFFSWLDKNRRLILRYDTLITSYESWTWLASLRLIKI
jgi:putative transposase